MSRGNNVELDPELLAGLEEEANYAEKTVKSSKYMPKVKVAKGDSVLVRLLPVEIGTNKFWLGRYAQHWIGRTRQRPVFCKRHTSPYLGGDSNSQCGACDLVENSKNLENQDQADRGYRISAGLGWYGVALVWATQPKGAIQPTYVRRPDCFVAHELAMMLPAFEQLKLIASRYAIKGTKGIIDIDAGVDIWFDYSNEKQIILRPDSQRSIFEDDDSDETRQQIINDIWSTIHLPRINFATEAEMAEFCTRAKDFILRGEAAVPEPGQGQPRRGAKTYSQDFDESSEFGDFNTGAPSRKAPVVTQKDLDSAPPVERRPAPAKPQPAPQPIPQAPPPAAPVSVPQQAQPTQANVPQPAPVTAPRQSKLVSIPKLAPAPVATQTQPAARPVVATIPAQSEPVGDEDENVANEAVDPVPPIMAPIEEGQPELPQNEQTPPPVVKAQGSTRLNANMREALQKFKK